MTTGLSDNRHNLLPDSFYRIILEDIPVNILATFLDGRPKIKNRVLKGLSDGLDETADFSANPKTRHRLAKLAREDGDLFDALIHLWAGEYLAFVAFVEMWDRRILLENWEDFRDILGPERFWAVCHVLGYRRDPSFLRLDEDSFWKRNPSSRLEELFYPVREVWRELCKVFPEALRWFAPAWDGESHEQRMSTGKNSQKTVRKEMDRRHRVEKKLSKVRERLEVKAEELRRAREEIAVLRRRIRILEESFENRLRSAIKEERKRYFQPFVEKRVDIVALAQASEELDGLIQKVERALALQKEMDRTYGTVDEVARKLIQVEMYLREVERIHRDSLMVHPEIRRVKSALLEVRERMLQRPGIQKVLRREPHRAFELDLLSRVRLWDPVPANLPKVQAMSQWVKRLIVLGLMDEDDALVNSLEMKRRQILEGLYAQFEPFSGDLSNGNQRCDIDGLVASGQSRSLDLYIDGYNILLKVAIKEDGDRDTALAEIRDAFIEAVGHVRGSFRKVYLVFDGVESSRDRRGNLEIIFSDKRLGITADAILVDLIRRKRDRMALLVTADQEIIEAVEERVYGLVSPLDFYRFIYDDPFPIGERMG